MMEAPTADYFDYVESADRPNRPDRPEEFQVGVRGWRAMRSLGCESAESLSQFSEFEVKCVRNVGDAAIRELKGFLSSHNLAFKADPKFAGERKHVAEQITKLVRTLWQAEKDKLQGEGA